jgi:hypothetical protein
MNNFGLAPLKREGSVAVFETETGGHNSNFPPPWKKEGYYYVLYGVPDWVKKVLTQPFNLGK